MKNKFNFKVNPDKFKNTKPIRHKFPSPSYTLDKTQSYTKDEATQELYKVIFYNKEKTKLEDIQWLVEQRCYLSGITAIYGLPLVHALKMNCDKEIIRYLVEKCGIDSNDKNICIDEVYQYKKYFSKKTNTHLTGITFTLSYYRYNTVKNYFINLYKRINGDSKMFTAICNRIIDERGWGEKEELNPLYVSFGEEGREAYIEKIRELCEICKINYDELKNETFELPDNIVDCEIPQDTQSYNWNWHDFVYYVIESDPEADSGDGYYYRFSNNNNPPKALQLPYQYQQDAILLPCE